MSNHTLFDSARAREANRKSQAARARNKALGLTREDKLKKQLQLARAERDHLRSLIRRHHAAVHDGVGNWGRTESDLFDAVA